ncbi:MAG: hypothetical protein GF317_14465 [Candidatus Lokiarchaeota archaeon]|nr:hypothetical protein [Candidatus Lokiarchaeota archaeon]MBD3200810.1 hypothetical protein [Candidatus Lokiarchaeota archaeon]
MDDKKRIKRIIDSFRILISDIFNDSKYPDIDMMIFSSTNKKLINTIVNNYFDAEIKQNAQNIDDINIMRDGVLYLLQRIRKADLGMKAIIYATLFKNDSILSEREILDVLEKFNLSTK